MSDILPLQTVLPRIPENDPVDISFSYVLTEPNSSLVSLEIIAHTPNDTITIDGARFHGRYTNMFALGTGALKYVTKDNVKHSASRWEDLPDPKTADLYEWHAPTVLQTTFEYTVKLVYQVIPEITPPTGGSDKTTPPTVTPKPVIHEITKTYSQLVYGNWSIWANMLRDYVQRGK